jgi:hypothetical protein
MLQIWRVGTSAYSNNKRWERGYYCMSVRIIHLTSKSWNSVQPNNDNNKNIIIIMVDTFDSRINVKDFKLALRSSEMATYL